MLFRKVCVMLERIFPVLETERLVLRRILPEDVAAVYRIYSDPKVAEYDTFMPIDSMAAARSIIANYNREFEQGQGIRWGIAQKEDNCIIGTCGFMNFNWNSRRCEIGFGLATAQSGKGIATEAVGKITAYGFEVLELNRIEGFVDVRNTASVRLLRRLNFVQEGVLREREYFKGLLHDETVMAILKSDYRKHISFESWKRCSI